MANQITTQIRDRIKVKLQEITQLNNVVGYPDLDPMPMPAATITPIGIEPDTSQGENVRDYRTYIYRIDVFEPVLREEANTVSTAIYNLYEIGERVMDKFTLDKQWASPTSFQDNVASGINFIGLEPVIGEFTQDPESKALILEVTLRVTVLVPNLNCT